MQVRVLLATVVAMLVWTGTAGAHQQPLGFGGFGLGSSWLDPDDPKIRGFTAAAAAPQSNAPQSYAPCVRGMAGEFPCERIDLLSNLPLSSIGGGEIGNDIWGWTDPRTGREYAIMGTSTSTGFVDVTDPQDPKLLGTLPTQGTPDNVLWRDIKVYRDHAFIVSEHIGHGMQVFDLTRLREVDNAPATFTADAVYTGVSNTHNLGINEESGFAYLVGTNTCGNGEENGGLHMVDISEPLNPTFAGCAIVDDADGNTQTESNNYVHDVECVNYEGPDERFAGREICFGSNENAVVIYDVTDKSNPEVLSQTTYPTAVYTHQGWLTDDRKWFVFNDEGDEDGFGNPPTVPVQTTYILNVEDLVDTPEVMASPNNTTSIDHNLYIDEGYIYESNYTSGLRIFTERSVPSGDLDEVAWFDLYPEDDDTHFDGGTWSNYPFYKKKGVVAVSSIDRGLFVLQARLRSGKK